MTIHQILAMGESPNVFGSYIAGRRAAQQARIEKERNALAKRVSEAQIQDLKRRKMYSVVSNAFEAGDPHRARQVLQQAKPLLVEDQDDERLLNDLIASDDQTFMEKLEGLYAALRPAPQYGSPMAVSRGGRNILAQINQYGRVRPIEGAGPPIAPPKPQKPEKPDPKRSGPAYELTPADENALGRMVAARFGGTWDPITGSVVIRDDKVREDATNVLALATRIFLDAKRKGLGKDLTRAEAFNKAMRQYAMKRKAGAESGPFRVDAITGPAPKPRGGIKFLGYE